MSISAKRKPTAQREQTTESGTVVDFPGRPPRSYLTPDEVGGTAFAAASVCAHQCGPRRMLTRGPKGRTD